MTPILSFFDQSPNYNGITIPIRGSDGYFDATAMSKALTPRGAKPKRFSNWTRTKFAKQLLEAVSARTGIPITAQNPPSSHMSRGGVKPLIDVLPGSHYGIWLHPYVAMSYAMSNPDFQAFINICFVDLMQKGTLTMHHLSWTPEERRRGEQFNKDDWQEIQEFQDWLESQQ